MTLAILRRCDMKAKMLSVCAVLITVVCCMWCRAKSAPPDRDCLAGLNGVYVSAETCPEAEKHGIHKRKLKTDVTRQLTKSGIEVLSESGWKQTPGLPMLSIDVTMTAKADLKGAVAVDVHVRFTQNVLLERDPARRCNGAVTWEMGEIQLTSSDHIKDSVKTLEDYLTRFIADYLAANPAQTQVSSADGQNTLQELRRPATVLLKCPKCGNVFVPRRRPPMPGFFADRCPRCNFSPTEDAIKRRGLNPDRQPPE